MIAVISFTANGSRINRRLGDWFRERGETCSCTALARYAALAGVTPLSGSYKDWCRDNFDRADVLIFIGASGIAVRGIAPYVKDKKTDPAVLVIDEQANFVISLLSGHIGGANEMTEAVADFLGAVPVITTGTDVNNTFAVDVFARKNDLYITDMAKAKKIAACMIDKEPVGFACELPLSGRLHPKLIKGFAPGHEMEISVTVREACDERTLNLIPRVLHLGIGCRRGTPVEAIEERVAAVMAEEGLSYASLASCASIDLKKDEEGLIGFCKNHGLPFHVYSSEELKELKGDFTPSKFVSGITGVDNVCERSALLDALGGDAKAEKEDACRILRRKTAGGGVTVAIAMKDRSISFE